MKTTRLNFLTVRAITESSDVFVKNKRKILVVEDEPEIAQFYAEILSDILDVVIAFTGEYAIKQIQSINDIDLVLLDYRLSDMSGIEVLKAIKQAKPAAMVIIVTAFGDEDVAVQSLRFGAKDYLKKPVDSSDLINRIELHLGLKTNCKNSRRNISLNRNHSTTASVRPPSSSRNFYKIQKALEYIDLNCTQKINLNSVAQKACISRYHFSRTFKKLTGVSYQDYVNNRRIEKAKAYLGNLSLTITDVAFAVGYSDLTHFERIFKKLAGTTPTEYRMQIIKKSDTSAASMPIR